MYTRIQFLYIFMQKAQSFIGSKHLKLLSNIITVIGLVGLDFESHEKYKGNAIIVKRNTLISET